MKTFLVAMLVGGIPLAMVIAGAPADPPVVISLGERHGHVTPCRNGFNHTGGGNIDVAQPSPDTLVITMTGVAVAGGHPTKFSTASMNFDLQQCFEIAFNQPGLTRAKVTLEGRAIGALRSHANGGGSAQEGPGNVALTSGNGVLAAISTPAHSVKCGENLSVNCRTGPQTFKLTGGQLVLNQSWRVAATNPSSILPCKAASAEFAPDPALDPLWISYWEPFHGANKKDFGFQVILRVAPDNGAAAP